MPVMLSDWQYAPFSQSAMAQDSPILAIGSGAGAAAHLLAQHASAQFGSVGSQFLDTHCVSPRHAAPTAMVPSSTGLHAASSASRLLGPIALNEQALDRVVIAARQSSTCS